MNAALLHAEPHAPPLLSVSHLNVGFGPVRGLSDVELTVAPGELVALAGEPGAGKSALVRCIAGDIAPADGEILLDGRPVPPDPGAAGRRGISVVWQDLVLCDNLDVAGNVLLGQEAGRQLFSPHRLHAEAAALLEQSTFLSSSNLVNLFVEAAAYILFGAAEIWVLLLSEIDLSVGYVAAVGAFVIAELIAAPVGLPWWLGIIGGIVVCAFLGWVQGTLITRLGLPSFIVTLGGLLGFEGVMLEIANIDKSAVGGVMSISSNGPVYNLVNGNMSPALGWIALVVIIAVFAAVTLTGTARRKARGLSTGPMSVTVLRIVVTAIGGFVIVLICNLNRGNLTTLEGVPWVIPFVLLIILGFSFFLSRTRPGRYIYAIGANPEAARRAGINVARIRTLGFVMCSVTAGLAGLAYESRQGSISTDIDGGNLVLFGVAAAVIGGTSLFGGKGKMLHALLGGIVIAAVFDGLALMNVSAAVQDMATAVVLIAAVTLDSLVRRRATVR